MRKRFQAWWGRPGWDRFVHVVAAVTFFSAIWAFGWIAHEVGEGDHTELENRIMHAMRRDGVPLGSTLLASAMRDVTAMGSAVVVVTLTLLILGFLFLSGKYRVAILIAVATAGGQAANAVLKNAFNRARPDAGLHLVEVHSTSFPSGHAMGGSIFYLTMGVLLARTARRRREQVYLICAALLLTTMVAFSRVYLGVHYPSDVIAGCAAGTAWAMLCWFITDWLGRRGKLRAETGEPATA